MALVQAVANDNGAGATTLRVNISSSTAGSCLALFIGVRAQFVTGVSDSASNTYTAAYTPLASTEGNGCWVFPNAGAGVTWIEATFDTTRASVGFAIEEDNTPTSSVVDKTAQAASATTNPADSGNTATTSQNDAVGYGIASSAESGTVGVTAGTDWTAVTGTGITSGGRGNTGEGNYGFLERRVYSTTGSYNATFANASAQVVQASIVVMKSGPPPPAPRIVTPTQSITMMR